MTLIIAEAGVNHNGDEALALQLVDAAYLAGADIVKFQTFKAKNIVTEAAKQAEYQLKNTQIEETQFSMLSRLELSYEAHHRLLARCTELGVEFLSTAFDLDSLKFLVSDLGVQRLKIPSGEITNAPLVLAHAQTGLSIIVSTGMATLSEIEMVLGVIAFGYLYPVNETPNVEKFATAYASAEGQKILKERVTILHCTTEYPAPMDEINLKAMDNMAYAFGLPTGYSDHSEGVTIPIAAVARGACIVEKHFTLDKEMEGPDHKASLNPEELKLMVGGIRNVEKALGHGVKIPSASEVNNKVVARKSLVAATCIAKGQVFSDKDIDIKRPGGGMTPYAYWSLLGKTATKEYDPGDLICE